MTLLLLLGKLDSLLWPLIERLPHDWYSSPLLPSFSSLMRNISLCSFCFSLLLHFLNVIPSQNTSDQHIDFTKSNVGFYRTPLSELFFPSVFLFPCFSLIHLLDDIYRVGEKCFYFAAADQRLWCDDLEDKVLCAELRYSPLHRAFLG